MPAILYISRVPEPLQLDAQQQIPDAWAKWDLLSQGLVSRYLARSQKSSHHEFPNELSSWVMLHPFVASRPSVYSIWNSPETLKTTDLQGLKASTGECHIDHAAFSASEIKTLRTLWPESLEWNP